MRARSAGQISFFYGGDVTVLKLGCAIDQRALCKELILRENSFLVSN